LIVAVCTGRRHFPDVNNVPSTARYWRNVRRYIPHGYCDDYADWASSDYISHTCRELVYLLFTMPSYRLATLPLLLLP